MNQRFIHLAAIPYSAEDLPVPVPSSLKFYTDLPGRLAQKNHVLFRDVVDLLAQVDRQKNSRWRKILGPESK